MPQFKVQIAKTIRYVGTVVIEAESLDEARKKSQYIHELHCPIDVDEIEWVLDPICSDDQPYGYEIVNVDECEDAEESE